MKLSTTAVAALAAAAITAAAVAVVAAPGGGRSGALASAPVAAAPVPVVRAAHGGGGGGGHVTPPTPTVPATWPAGVPVPPGQLTGAFDAGNNTGWTLALTTPLDPNHYTAAVLAEYTTHGFARVNNSPYQLTNGTFTISIAMRPRDHIAPTDYLVAFGLSRN